MSAVADTVSETIVSWLSAYSGITNVGRADTEEISGETVALELLEDPGTDETPFVDGSGDVIAYYIFQAQRDTQQAPAVSNQEWLGGLERWVRLQNLTNALPVLSGGRECFKIRIDEASYLRETAQTDMVFQLGVEVSYFEPKITT